MTYYVIDVLDQASISFPERFRRFLEVEELDIDWVLINGVQEPEKLKEIPDLSPRGIVISGSIRGVYDSLPWMFALEELIRSAHAQGIPLFGICFGHQILAHALGGKVAKAPAWEFGVFPVYRHEEQDHPWLEGFDCGTLTCQTHQDQVTELPPGAKVHGFSRQTAYQIFSIGSCLGVQFHPEYTYEDLRFLAGERAERLINAGSFLNHEHVQAFAQKLKPADTSRRILRNFLTQHQT